MSRTRTSDKRFLPSTPAAVVAGALGMPLLMIGLRFIETSLHSQLLAILWSVVVFLVPVFFATADVRYLARRRRESGGFFRPLTSSDDFRLFYIPAWKRMVAGFVSGAFSIFLLSSIGVGF
jgi:hypothetical protein